MSFLKRIFLIVFVVFSCSSSFVRTESLVSEPKSLTNQNGINHRQYSSVYANGGSQYPATSRDSFTDSASISVLGVQSSNDAGSYSHGQPMMYVPHRTSFGGGSSGQSYGDYGVGGDDDDSEGNSLGGLGGEIGLLGLLGLKGLKGIPLFKAVKALAILGPIVGPIFGPLLAIAALILLLGALLGPILPIVLPLLLLLGILFLPIPVITIPGRSATASLLETARGALDATISDGCAERITCEISRAAKLYGLDPPWVTNVIGKSSSKSKWVEKVSRAYKSTECKNYECDIVNSFKKIMKLD